MGKEIMLRFMAKMTQALEAHQVLMACLFVELPGFVVELPGFVAVHPALTPTYLAVVVRSAIDVASNTVPLATRQ
jgi:hypothetical protein